MSPQQRWLIPVDRPLQPAPRAPRRHRAGASAVVVALAMVTLLGTAALVVDLGHISTVQQELQAAADAGAHAGARQLDGSADGLLAATDQALRFAEANEAAQQPVSLTAGDGATIELGIWEDGGFSAGGDVEDINAVRAVARRADLVPWFSGAAFGTDALAASAESIAVHQREPAGEVECFLPLAVADCTINDLYGSGINHVDFTVNPPSVDNVGWAMPNTSASASSLRDQLRDCNDQGAAAVGDDVNLNNGVSTTVLTEVADLLSEGTGTSWEPDYWGSLPAQDPASGVDTGGYGNTIEGVMFTFSDDSYCSGSGGGFTGDQPISGFVWAAIYDVVTHGPADGRTVKVRLEVTDTREVGSGGGGSQDFGVVGRDVVMVH
jgi:hypothetical protein